MTARGRARSRLEVTPCFDAVSGGPDLGKEAVDLATEDFAFGGELARDLEGRARPAAGLAGGLADAGDVGRGEGARSVGGLPGEPIGVESADGRAAQHNDAGDETGPHPDSQFLTAMTSSASSGSGKNACDLSTSDPASAGSYESIGWTGRSEKVGASYFRIDGGAMPMAIFTPRHS